MKIAVVGSGYVGLVTAACLAEVGHQVMGVDIDADKVAQLQDGEIPIYEPKLAELVTRNQQAWRLAFTTSLEAGVAEAEVIFLALPTPPGKDGHADLSAVLAVANQLGDVLNTKRYVVIVNKSTVPVGTAERVQQTIAAKGRAQFDVVSNPEFLREGFAIDDFMQPDRIVVGSGSQEARAVMADVYEAFTSGDNPSPLHFMDERSAELAKYAANSFLATKITFMNEIANLCDRIDADVDAVKLVLGSDERIGGRFLNPGIGYGGSCFPKDIQALDKAAHQHGYELGIVRAAMAANRKQQHVLVEKLRDRFAGDLAGKSFALWGLAFKPNTDDVRVAPALVIIDDLLKAGAKVAAYDPEALENVRGLYEGKPGPTFCTDKYEALDGADALLIATEWEEFHVLDWEQIKQALKQPLILDGRNLFRPEQMSARGFEYLSIGRGASNREPSFSKAPNQLKI